MNKRDKPWWDRFLGPGDRERINEAIRQQLSEKEENITLHHPIIPPKIAELIETPCDSHTDGDKFVFQVMREFNINPQVVAQQKECIDKLIVELETLRERIRLGRYFERPCPLGTEVYCLISKSVVKGYIHSYEDMYNIQNKAVIRVVKIAFLDIDGIVNKTLSEFGKTIFLNETNALEALSKI